MLVGVAGTGLTFGMWWTYFLIPSAGILAAHRERLFPCGYGHILIFAATGAGLHVRHPLSKARPTSAAWPPYSV